MAVTAPKPQRRTQEERRASTRNILLEATLTCLGRDGYAQTSISSINAEAGVSRGALLHHYPTKNDLIAAAIVYFYRQRLERFKTQLLGADTEKLSLEDRLRVLQEDFETWYPTASEIDVVMRTNEEIAQKQELLSAADNEPMAREYEQLFPEFAATENPRDLIGITCYLMRGLASESREAVVQRKFEIFASMLKAYLAGPTISE